MVIWLDKNQWAKCLIICHLQKTPLKHGGKAILTLTGQKKDVP